MFEDFFGRSSSDLGRNTELVVERGLHETGTDRVETDTARQQLPRERLGERQESGLCRGTDAGRCCTDMSTVRGDKDDRGRIREHLLDFLGHKG